MAQYPLLAIFKIAAAAILDLYFGHISLAYEDITGSTVVLTCCKGDSSSQWETPIFGPPQTENPLTDLDKICHQ